MGRPLYNLNRRLDLLLYGKPDLPDVAVNIRKRVKRSDTPFGTRLGDHATTEPQHLSFEIEEDFVETRKPFDLCLHRVCYSVCLACLRKLLHGLYIYGTSIVRAPRSIVRGCACISS